MISLSEPLLEGVTALRPVLPLEFHEIEDLSNRQAEIEFVEPAPAEVESDNMKALSELEEKLRTQMERCERLIEKARQKAKTVAREELQEEFEEKAKNERAAVARVCEQFATDRMKYFAEVEAEVVRLALAIAARVLHRETQFDPLLLRSTVRIALERVQETTAVTLRVPEGQEEEWKGIVAGVHEGGVIVVGDAKLQTGECVLETNVGRVDLGVKVQLEEIEKGFFDLLQKRPA